MIEKNNWEGRENEQICHLWLILKTTEQFVMPDVCNKLQSPRSNSF